MKKLIVLLLPVLVFSGCTMMKYGCENKNIEASNIENEALASKIEAENSKLEKKQRELVDKLASRQMTFDELTQSLNDLIEKKKYLLSLQRQKNQDVKVMAIETKVLEDDISILNAKREKLKELTKNISLTESQMEKQKMVIEKELKAHLEMGLNTKYRR